MARHTRIAARRRQGIWRTWLVRSLLVRLPGPFAGPLYCSARKLPSELENKRIRVSKFLSDLPVLNVMGMLAVTVN